MEARSWGARERVEAALHGAVVAAALATIPLVLSYE
jgi:hypothetical protein